MSSPQPTRDVRIGAEGHHLELGGGRWHSGPWMWEGFGVTCVFKAGASTNGQYGLVCINGSNIQGGWQSCDYYGVPGAGMGVLDGSVTDKSGDPVAGMDVTAYGTQSGGATTNATGYYAIQLAAGSYRVLPSGGPQGKSAPSYRPSLTNATVTDGHTTHSDFQLQAAIELQLHFNTSTVPADGLHVVNGLITTTEFGKPLPNVAVQLEVMPGKTAAEAVTGGPRASVCSAGSRVWPTGTMSDPDGFPVDITTDATGHDGWLLPWAPHRGHGPWTPGPRIATERCPLTRQPRPTPSPSGSCLSGPPNSRIS